MNPLALIAVIKINVLRRPLWQAETVEECLGINRPKMVQMVEDGRLPWSFDIGYSSKRKEYRILGHCVVELQSGPISEIGCSRNLNLPQVIDLILPTTRTALRGTEIQRLFSCRSDMVRKFHTTGEFKRVPEKLEKHGPNSSPRFTRDSVAKFLEKRRIT